MPMDSEMNDISLSDFTPYTIVASLEMSDEPTFMVYMVEATTRWAITIHVPMGYMESLAIVLHALIMVYLVLYMVAITEQAFMALLFQTILVCLWETTMLAISVEKYMRLGQ